MAEEQGQQTMDADDTDDSQDDLLSVMEGDDTSQADTESLDSGGQDGIKEVGFSDGSEEMDDEDETVIDLMEEIEQRNPETPTDSSPDDEDDSVSGEGEQSPEGKQSEEDDSQEPSFSEDLLQRADEHGYSREEAEAFGTPGNLQKALQSLDERMEQTDSSDDGDEGEDNDSPHDSEDEFEIDLDPSLYDPEIVDTMKNMKNHYEGQMEQMQQQVEQVNDQLIRRDVQAQEAEFDSAISDLGEEYAELLGDAPVQQLDGDAREQRTKVLDETWEKVDRYLNKGEEIPPVPELIKSAANAVLGDKVNEVARKQVRNEVKERRDQSIGRPSGRNGEEELDGRQKAIQRVRQMKQSKGEEPEEF